MPIIQVDHLTKEYNLGAMQGIKQALLNNVARLTGKEVEERPTFTALNDISFSVNKGEVLGIIGHNGAGKSTLLKMLSGISHPTRGQVHVEGRIAPLIEVGAGFIPDFTGRENIYLNGSILGMSRSEIKRKFDDIVEFSEIAEFIDTPVKRYSSGMQVKLAFSVATSIESEILIIDEVLAVGDLAFQQKCIERMEKLIKSDDRTVIIVGHNIRQLQRICTRVMLMDHGRITNDGNPSDVCGIFFREAQERTFTRHGNHEGEIEAQQGTDIVRVLKVETLDDEHKPQNGTGMHDPLTIRVTFACTKKLVRPEIVVGLHTSDFVHVLAVGNALSESRPDFEPGIHQATCRIADIPVRPFSYGLRLTILDQYRVLLWYAENIQPVLITPGRHDITKIPEVGLVDMPGKWSFSTLEKNTP